MVASGHSQNDGPEILTPAQAAAWTLHDPLPESYAEGSESPFLALHGFCFFCEGCLVVKIDHLQMGRPWHSNQYFYREGRFCMFGASRDFSGLTTQPLPQRKQFDSSPNCCYCRPGLRKRSRPTRILRCTAAKARVGWQQVYGVTQHQLLGHHPEAAGLSLWKPWRTGMGCFYIWYISRSSINLGVDFSRCMWLCGTQCQDCNIFFLATSVTTSFVIFLCVRSLAQLASRTMWSPTDSWSTSLS